MAFARGYCLLLLHQVAPGMNMLEFAEFTMVDIASQTIGNDFSSFDIGDSVTFNVTLDLPQVSVEGKSDLIFEIFGTDDVNGRTIQ